MFPLALEGLVQDDGHALNHRKLILHFNVGSWLTSPKADLSEEKEEDFNHSRLVPQFSPRIPSYHAPSANERLSATIESHVGALAWTVTSAKNGVLRPAQHSGIRTLQDDGNDPPKYPNAWRNPLALLRAGIPTEGQSDPLPGTAKPATQIVERRANAADGIRLGRVG